MVPLRVRPVTPSLALWRSGFSASPSEGEGHRFESDQGFQMVGVAQWESIPLWRGDPGPIPGAGSRRAGLERQSVGLLSRKVGVQVSSLAPRLYPVSSEA